jgi:hypothetical protein
MLDRPSWEAVDGKSNGAGLMADRPSRPLAAAETIPETVTSACRGLVAARYRGKSGRD